MIIPGVLLDYLLLVVLGHRLNTNIVPIEPVPMALILLVLFCCVVGRLLFTELFYAFVFISLS